MQKLFILMLALYVGALSAGQSPSTPPAEPKKSGAEKPLAGQLDAKSTDSAEQDEQYNKLRHGER